MKVIVGIEQLGELSDTSCSSKKKTALDVAVESIILMKLRYNSSWDDSCSFY
jgi:hypothetical protein